MPFFALIPPPLFQMPVMSIKLYLRTLIQNSLASFYEGVSGVDCLAYKDDSYQLKHNKMTILKFTIRKMADFLNRFKTWNGVNNF